MRKRGQNSMFKKAQGMSINTIIVAIIVLVVLVVLVMIFSGYFGGWTKSVGGMKVEAKGSPSGGQTFGLVNAGTGTGGGGGGGGGTGSGTGGGTGTPTTQCSDGTPPGSCSATKPMYCSTTGTTAAKCTTCGCPTGQTCQPATGACTTTNLPGSIIAASDSPAEWKAKAVAVCDGTSDQVEINKYLTAGSTVQLAPGTFNADAYITPKSGSKLLGQGNPTVINLKSTAIYVSGVDNIEVGNFKLTGTVDTYFKSAVFMGGSNPINSGFYLHDIWSTVKGGDHFVIYANAHTNPGATLSGISFVRCFADNPDGFGFIINGEGSSPKVEDVTFYRCSVNNAAVAPTRVVQSDGICWDTGFDFAEFGGATTPLVNRITAIKCTVDGAWESDYHFEGMPAKKGIVMLDNDARRAGQKPNPVYGVGYMLPMDYEVPTHDRDDIVFNGNTGGSNTNGDVWAWTPSDAHYTLPKDIIYPAGKTVTRISQSNCVGMIVTNGIYKDLYLYSSDNNPVSQQIELGGTYASNDGKTYSFSGTKILAQFNDYAIIRLVKTSATQGQRVLLGFSTDYAFNSGTYTRSNLDYLTHFGYSDVRPVSASDPTLTIPNNKYDWEALNMLANMAHKAGKKAVVSLWDNDAFPAFADNSALLAKFASNVADMCTKYKLDGIYIDSENSGATPTQRVKLAAALYNAVHPLGVDVGYYSAGMALPVELSQYVDYVDVTYNSALGVATEDARFTDYVNNMQALVNLGWPKSKLNTVFMVYGFSDSPREESCSYGDIVAAGLDVYQSKSAIAAIDSSWYGANHAIPGGVLYWDGINLNNRKVDYILANGYGGAMFFTSDYDTVPNNSPLSLIRNVYERMNGIKTTGRTYYVAKTGSDNNPGTLALPWLTFQKATNTVVAGDTVYIRAGVYNERLNIINKQGTAAQRITFRNYPGETPIIDGTGLGTQGAVYLDTASYITIDGFEVRNTASAGVQASYGGNHYLEFLNMHVHNCGSSSFTIGYEGVSTSHILISGCNIHDVCTNGGDEGVSIINTDSAEVANCYVADTNTQAGIDFKVGCTNGKIHGNEIARTNIYVDTFGYTTSNIDIYNNYFHDFVRNSAIFLGSEQKPASLTGINIYNNFFYNTLHGCFAAYGEKGGFTELNFKFVNNVCYKNAGNGWYDIIFGDPAIGDPSGNYKNCLISNNIIVSATSNSPPMKNSYPSNGGITIDHNLFYCDGCTLYPASAGNPHGTNPVYANPLLVNPPVDFHLRAGSPAVDAGTATGAPATDYAGTARPQGTACDIGAYEYSATTTAGNTYYVAKNGNDNNPGTLAQPWLTIQKAANTVVPGDTVYIRDGTYNEAVFISSKSGSDSSWLKFQSYPGETATIDGTGVYTPVQIYDCTYIELNGLQVQNSPTRSGVHVHGDSNHINLINLVVHDTYGEGILIDSKGYDSPAHDISNIMIDGCQVYNACLGGMQEALSLVAVNGFEIKNCKVHDTALFPDGGRQAGIDTKVGCTNGKIHNNEVYNVGAGLYIDEFGQPTSNIEVYNNIFHDNGVGILLGCEQTPADMRNINMYNNILYGNRRGFQIYGEVGAFEKTFTFTNNILYHNGGAGLTEIFLADATGYSNCVIRNNIIVASDYTDTAILNKGYAEGGVAIDHNLIYNENGYINYPYGSDPRYPEWYYGTNAVFADPLLMNPPFDFSPQPNSPVIDAGTSTDAPATDIAGVSRPQGAGYDIGAYETAAIACTLTSASIANCAGGTCEAGETVTMTATFSGTCPTGTNIYLQIDAASTDGLCDIQYNGGTLSGITKANPTLSGTTYTGTWTVPTIPSSCSGKTAYAYAAAIRTGTPDTGTTNSLIQDTTPTATTPVAGYITFPTTTSQLLFKSGFESYTTLGPVTEGVGRDTFQTITGTDQSTGFSWPLMLWNPDTTLTGLHLIRPNAGQPKETEPFASHFFNGIVTVTGQSGTSTKALLMKLDGYPDNTCCPQDVLSTASMSAPITEQYMRVWVKLPPELLTQSQANPGSLWHVLWEFKTRDDYRLATMVESDSNGVPYWYAFADPRGDDFICAYKDPVSGKTKNDCDYHFFDISNKNIPVPINQWFLMEVYLKRSTGSDGRFAWAVNGQTIADYQGANYGISNEEILGMFYMNLYGNHFPLQWWLDDFEIRDSPPCAAFPCGAA